MRFRLLAALPMLALCLTVPATAEAGPRGGAKGGKAASGRAGRAAKRESASVETYRRAADLDPSPQRKFDLARALVDDKKLVEASTLLNEVIAAGPAARRVAPAAKKLLAQTETRVPWVYFQLEGIEPENAKVTVDGEPVDATFEVPVDPGNHTVVVEGPGVQRTQKRFAAREGQHEKVVVQVKGGKAAAAKKPAVEKDEDDADEGGSSPVPMALAFGGGAVGLGVGVAFGVVAMSQTAEVERYCEDGHCPSSQEQSLAAAKANGTISTIGFAAAGVGAAAGVILLLTSDSGDDAKAEKALAPHRRSERASAPRVAPYVGAGDAGLVGRF